LNSKQITMMDFGYNKLYIDGKLVDAANKARVQVICPANGKVVAEIAEAGRVDAENALIAAEKGFKYWSGLSLAQRTDWMLKLREAVLKNEDLLRQAMIHEMGKTYEGAWEDIEAMTNSLEWYPAAMKNYRDEQIPDYENTHRHQMIRQPIGVVVAYVAWNFPLLNAAFKIGPALAAGCSIILKPSDLSPLSAYLLGKILADIEFPAGVVNILSGPVDEVAKTLTSSSITRAITMIGSTQTALKVIADSATSIKKMSMELGGNAPFIIFDDADLEVALDLAIALKFGNSGQICVAANRIFVHEKIYTEFLNRYIKKASSLKLGFGKQDKPDMGPVISAASRDRILGLIDDAVQYGAKLELRGKVPAGKEEGYWIEPSILSAVTPKMRVFKEEIFGPVAPIIGFNSDDEVLKMANDTDHGLASYIFTNDHHRIMRFVEELEFGEVQVNGVKYAIYLPHGGIKNSGVGYDCSHLALEDYMIKKRVSIAK
jgi:succinate-semialdehyde dehydrogenase/glutarate-semialdehyde dehydrogenase